MKIKNAIDSIRIPDWVAAAGIIVGVVVMSLLVADYAWRQAARPVNTGVGGEMSRLAPYTDERGKVWERTLPSQDSVAATAHRLSALLSSALNGKVSVEDLEIMQYARAATAGEAHAEGEDLRFIRITWQQKRHDAAGKLIGASIENHMLRVTGDHAKPEYIPNNLANAMFGFGLVERESVLLLGSPQEKSFERIWKDAL